MSKENLIAWSSMDITQSLIKNYAKANSKDYDETVKATCRHIRFDKSLTKEEADFQIIRGQTHDGTLALTMYLCEKIINIIMNKETCHIDYVNEFKNGNIVDIEYTIGDFTLDIKHEEGRQHEIISLPVKCHYKYKSDTVKEA